MADEKTPPQEEAKWWIDRGPVKEREKPPQPRRGIIEQWAYDLLKDYRQEQALRNVADVNQKILKELPASPGEWGYLSLGVGSYPPQRLAKIKSGLPLPADARAIAIDAGYSVRVVITGEPAGERLLDINFTEAPSLDYWVNGELVEERVYSNLEDALRKLRRLLPIYLSPSEAA